jgi:hypothetical protein
MERPELYLPLLLAFPISWAGWFALAHWGGWNRLARQFPADRRPEGAVLRGQSIGLNGWVNYSGFATLVESNEGLYVSLPFPFGFFHPPLLIPWAELRSPQLRTVLWQRFFAVQAGNPPVRMELPAGRFDHRFQIPAENAGTIAGNSASGTVPESKDDGTNSNRR